jgi:predicted ATPase/class 3 adenylate cyclase
MSTGDRLVEVLPTGVVTFLFTDIEGSTGKWEQHPIEMAGALAIHNHVVRASIAAHDGVVFETAGDSFVVVFGRPGDAILAAVDAQVALRDADWPGPVGRLSVRMALDTGSVEVRAGVYSAQHLLSRLSRLLAAGHGDQILASAESRAAVGNDLPPGLQLHALGEHRLKDLVAPQEIFQIVAPGPPWHLRTDFPALRTVRWSNLPIQLSPFVGRERVVAGVVNLLRDGCRVLTLTGPGGTGKTRVALEAAGAVIDDFEHGAAFVDLAPVREPDLVMPTIARTLGVAEVAGTPIVSTLTDLLGSRRALLVLDNFEQVVGAAPQVAELASAAAGITVLTTSRVPLRVSGEREHPVPALDLPTGAGNATFDEIARSESVRLFAERAAAINPAFTLTATNAVAVAEICTRLDGLPLAIELAAARIRLLSPEAIASRLGNRLGLLTGGASDADARQRTLRAAIAWSHELLSAPEQVLLRRLAAFNGGRTLAAIEEVCATDSTSDVLDGVESLVHNSLLKHEEAPDGDLRFVMLETIQEFAFEQLVASGELDLTRTRHARYFVELAESFDPAPNAQVAEAIELERMQVEHDNMRTAMEWALSGAEAGDPERTQIAARLVAALSQFWYLRGYWTEGSRWAIAAAAHVRPEDALLRASVLLGAGRLAVERGDYATGRDLFEESEPLLRQAGDLERATFALGRVGDCLYAMGDIESARPLITEAVARARRLGQPLNVGRLLSSLGELHRAEGDYTGARRLEEQALQILTEGGHRGSSAEVVVRCNLGHAMLRSGDATAAAPMLADALNMSYRLGSSSDMSLALIGLAGVAAVREEPLRAAGVFGAAESLIERLGAHLWPADRLDYEHYLAVATSQVDPAAFENARRAGRIMSLEDAIILAGGEVGGR